MPWRISAVAAGVFSGDAGLGAPIVAIGEASAVAAGLLLLAVEAVATGGAAFVAVTPALNVENVVTASLSGAPLARRWAQAANRMLHIPASNNIVTAFRRIMTLQWELSQP
jgi:hypothetical protein